MNNKNTYYEQNKKVGRICIKTILFKKGTAKSKEYENNKEMLQKTSTKQLQKSD